MADSTRHRKIAAACHNRAARTNGVRAQRSSRIAGWKPDRKTGELNSMRKRKAPAQPQTRREHKEAR